MLTKTVLWDRENKSIRGSIICLIITLSILILIIIGAFNEDVSMRLERMAALIGIFFSASFGVWRIGKAIEYKKRDEEE